MIEHGMNIRLMNPEVAKFAYGFVAGVLLNHPDISLEDGTYETPEHLNFAEGVEDELVAVALSLYFTRQKTFNKIITDGYSHYLAGHDAAVWAWFRHSMKSGERAGWGHMEQSPELSFLRTTAAALPRLELFTGDRNRMLIEWMEV